MEYNYETLAIRIDHGVAFATIDNPPVNVITVQLFKDLLDFTAVVEMDEAVRVVVFQSADPEFFIAHFDIELILGFPIDEPAEREEVLNAFHQLCERVRTMPKATIVKMAGRTGGGGNEFAASCDMRYGVRGGTVVSQMEVAIGILPGGSGTQRLPRLVGRGRAMEICLGCEDIDAETCERWGYLNRIFDSAQAMNEWVDAFALRMASWPAEALSRCKASINNAELELADGLREEAFLFQQTLRTDAAQQRMRKALEMGAQTREAELNMGDFCTDL